MSLPTRGETFAQLLHHLRQAQEAAATIGHLSRDDDPIHANHWLGVSEKFRQIIHTVTNLAQGRLQ